MTDVAANARRVLERVAAAAERAGRRPESVLLVAVSKTKPPEQIRAAVQAGVRAVGENYVQEARAKIAALGPLASWHLVGRLQRNKAREAALLFDLIQTLDTLALARRLDQIGRERGAPVRALVEVNLAAEGTKAGVLPGELPAFLEALGRLEGLRVEGLMAIPPPPQRPEDSRPHFEALRRLQERLAGATPPNVELRELSMGMSDDFEVAIAEGATIVRVGRAIFGPR